MARARYWDEIAISGEKTEHVDWKEEVCWSGEGVSGGGGWRERGFG